MTAQNVSDKKPYPSAPNGEEKKLRGDKISGDRYYDKDFAKQEWDKMWTRVWHIGGRLAQLEEAGDYILHNFLNESVVLVRQKDHTVRAFYNACQHRGNRFAQSETGFVNGAFVCPYHGWRFNLDGRLEDVQDPENFPQGNPCGKLNLKEVLCETWGGFVWYSMDPNAKPLLEYLDPVPALLNHRRMDQMVRVVWLTVRVNTNWKFSPDNFNESYHLPTVHPQMQQMIDEDYKNTHFNMYPNGHNRMIEQGQPSMRAQHPNEVEPVWEMMLREWGLDPDDFSGRARAGRKALQKAKRHLGKERGFDHFDALYDDELTDYFHHTLFPNVTLTGTSDGVHFFRTEPDPKDPEWCNFDYWYLTPQIRGQKDTPTVYGMRPHEEAEHEIVTYGSSQGGHHLGDFIDQDLSVAVAQQQGFHSRGYADAYLSGQENRVRRFHEVLNDYLEERR